MRIFSMGRFNTSLRTKVIHNLFTNNRIQKYMIVWILGYRWEIIF